MQITTNSQAANSISQAFQTWREFQRHLQSLAGSAKGEAVPVEDTSLMDKANSHLKDLCTWLDKSIQNFLKDEKSFQTQSLSLKRTVGRLLAVNVLEESHQTDSLMYETVLPRNREKFLVDVVRDVLFENASGYSDALAEWEPPFKTKIDSCAGLLLAEPILEAFEKLDPNDRLALIPIYRVVNLWAPIFEPLIKERIQDCEVDPSMQIRYAVLLNQMEDPVFPSEDHVDALVNLWKYALQKKSPIVCDKTGQFYPSEFFHRIKSIPESQYLIQFATGQLKALRDYSDPGAKSFYQAEILELLAKVEKIEFDQDLVDNLMTIWQEDAFESDTRASILKILLTINNYPRDFDYSSLQENLTEFIRAEDLEFPELRKLAFLALNAIPALSESPKALLPFVENAGQPSPPEQQWCNSLFLFAPIANLVRDFINRDDGVSLLADANNISARISLDPADRAAEEELFIGDQMQIRADRNQKKLHPMAGGALLMLGEASLREALKKITSPEKDIFRQGLMTLRLFYSHDIATLTYYFAKHIKEIRAINVSEPAIRILAKKDPSLLNYLSGHGLKLAL